MNALLIAVFVSILLTVLALLIACIWFRQRNVGAAVDVNVIVVPVSIKTIISPDAIIPAPIRIATTSPTDGPGDSMEGGKELSELAELHTSKKISHAQLPKHSSSNHCYWTAAQIRLNQSNHIARQNRQKEEDEQNEVDDHAAAEESSLGTARVSATLTGSLPLETLPAHLLTKSADSLDRDFVYVTVCAISLTLSLSPFAQPRGGLLCDDGETATKSKVAADAPTNRTISDLAPTSSAEQSRAISQAISVSVPSVRPDKSNGDTFNTTVVPRRISESNAMQMEHSRSCQPIPESRSMFQSTMARDDFQANGRISPRDSKAMRGFVEAQRASMRQRCDRVERCIQTQNQKPTIIDCGSSVQSVPHKNDSRAGSPFPQSLF